MSRFRRLRLHPIRRPYVFSPSTATPAATEHEGEDACPICTAAREGKTRRMFRGASFSAPPIPKAVLIAEAKKALARSDQAGEDLVPVIEYGSLRKGGSHARSAFVVDREGQIFWMSPTEHRLAARIPPGE